MPSVLADASAVEAPSLYVPTTCMTAIVGGSNFLRQLVRSFLEGQGYGVSLCIDQVDSAELGLQQALGHTGVVVLLLDHDPAPALQSIRQALQWSGALPLVVVSDELHPGTIHAALRNGTKGFLCTQADPRELARAIQMAQCGKVHLDPEVAQLLISEIAPAAGGKRREASEPALSPREIEIVQFVCDGLAAKEIAARLHVTLKTVENHKYNLYRKCGVGGMAALFRYAVHHGLVTI